MAAKHTFTTLLAYDEQGKAITYSITEEPVAGYDVNITGPTTVSGNDSFAVTNTYEATGSITFSGTKSISRGREIKEAIQRYIGEHVYHRRCPQYPPLPLSHKEQHTQLYKYRQDKCTQQYHSKLYGHKGNVESK